MNIINGENKESFGFVNEGWFSNRLYIFETEIQSNTATKKTKILECAKELNGAGIASYGKCIGFIMSCFSLATSVRIGEKTLYIDNESLCHYVLRKATHQGNNANAMGAMHDFYVKNKNGVETAAYDDATVKKVNTCFLNQINNSDVPLELWGIIQMCLKDIIQPDELDDEIQKFTKQFLRPYIRNEIDPDSTEERDRKPMIETLLTHLEQQLPDVDDEAECREKALNSYIMIATHGLFQNYHININSSMNRLEGFALYLSSYMQEDIEKKNDIEYRKLSQWYEEWNKADNPRLPTKDFLILLNALVPALEKDFPDANLSCGDLIEKAIQAINALRKQHKNDPIIKENREGSSNSIKELERITELKNNRKVYIKNYLGEKEYEKNKEQKKQKKIAV